MEIHALYTIEFPESTLIFTESASGALEYDGAADSKAGRARVRELLGREIEPLELVFPDELRRPLYHRDEASRGRVYRHEKTVGQHHGEEAVFGFLARFPELYALFLSGDYAAAGRILQFSKKLRPFKSLLRHILGSALFHAFLSYYLNDFSDGKDSALAALLGGHADAETNYLTVFEFAEPFIEAGTPEEFGKEAKRKFEHLLFTEKRRIVLPVVGTNFHSTIGEIAGTIASARKAGERQSIVEGIPAKEIDARIRGYVEDFSVHLTPEPYNPADAKAVAVTVRGRSGHTSHAGYLKRETAALFSRFSSSPSSLSARFFRITEHGADIEVRAG